MKMENTTTYFLQNIKNFLCFFPHEQIYFTISAHEFKVTNKESVISIKYIINYDLILKNTLYYLKERI